MRLKGHQIIGELRPCHTSCLYGALQLKGHQIIGELRQIQLFKDWILQLKGHQIIGELRQLFACSKTFRKIERSPDHWWVTTICHYKNRNSIKLKGHQIIGALRLDSCYTSLLGSIEWSPDHWWVTTYKQKEATLPHNWMVTRSLVSYDK